MAPTRVTIATAWGEYQRTDKTLSFGRWLNELYAGHFSKDVVECACDSATFTKAFNEV